MKKLTSEQLILVYKALGYVYNTNEFDVNIFGIRNANQVADSFDDYVGMFWKDIHMESDEHDDCWSNIYYEATTDPGLYYLNNPMREKGTAIMVPGQYIDCYQNGYHGRSNPTTMYEALEQVGPISFVRDGDKDDLLDFALMTNHANITKEVIKANVHTMRGSNPIKVSKGSAGCQVVRNSRKFHLEFMKILKDSAEKTKRTRFTYTLLTSQQIESILGITL